MTLECHSKGPSKSVLGGQSTGNSYIKREQSRKRASYLPNQIKAMDIQSPEYEAVAQDLNIYGLIRVIDKTQSHYEG